MNTIKHKNWIKTILKKFSFVLWDRFFVKETNVICVFGWIKREDNYKDFVILEINLNYKCVHLIATSSKKYSRKISRLLGSDYHSKCRRVENNFAIRNCITLKN